MARIYEKFAFCGGEGGRVWDDGVYDDVRKVFVGQDLSRITYVKFEYVKEDGEVVTREYGTTDQHPKEFAIEYPDEFLVSVEGSYNKVGLYATEVITSLIFKTSKGRVSPTFGQNLLGLVAGTKFSFEGKKIVGFHGRSDKALDALGVYFVIPSMGRPPFPLYRLSAQGGTEGSVWDDGNAFDHVIIKTLRICQDNCRITYLELEYEKGGKLETRNHGVKGEKTPSEFLLDSPDEYIISVEATYQKTNFFRNTVITSLKLETSKGRTSFFGYEVGKKFVLEQKGCVLVGFHGKEGEAIDALGAYFAQIPIPSAPAPTPTPAPAPAAPAPTAPTPAVGGIVAWDDGVYDNVKKIYVEEINYSITFVKFEYVKGTELVIGDDHGKKTSSPEVNVKEYVLEDDEYITGVDGHKNTRDGVDVVIGLLFKTNKRVLTPPSGTDFGDKFWLGRPDHKIVGFHGKASHVIHSIGASVERVVE